LSCRCAHCRRRFNPRPQNKDQRFCSRPICQKQRRNLWRKGKRLSDADYRANQRDAQRRWLAKNPDYYRNYRKNHPDYVEKNRQKQRDRNRRSGGGCSDLSRIAKGDAWNSERDTISGYYKVETVDTAMIAKSDASIVKLTYISNIYP
jgi:hypothetical protein